MYFRPNEIEAAKAWDATERKTGKAAIAAIRAMGFTQSNAPASTLIDRANYWAREALRELQQTEEREMNDTPKDTNGPRLIFVEGSWSIFQADSLFVGFHDGSGDTEWATTIGELDQIPSDTRLKALSRHVDIMAGRAGYLNAERKPDFGRACEGCPDEEGEDVKPYRVKFIRHPSPEVVHYCPDCRDLSASNYSGEIEWIEIDGERIHPEG